MDPASFFPYGLEEEDRGCPPKQFGIFPSREQNPTGGEVSYYKGGNPVFVRFVHKVAEQ